MKDNPFHSTDPWHQPPEGSHRRPRYTIIVWLVLYVFYIMCVTMIFIGCIFFALLRLGFMPLLGVYRQPFPTIALLACSIVVATVLAAMSGKRPLAPFQRLIQATEEIASGNFDVRVDIKGPRELERLGESFNAMAKELSGIETLRNDFVSNVSHEFKTPVVSIRGFAKLLKKDTLSEESRKEYLDVIIREADRLSKLAGNVLLLSKLEKQEAVGEKTTYALDEQIRRTILLLEPEWSKKKLEIEVELPAQQYTGNEELLQQVWLNLIGNAIKFTGEGGMVAVTLTSSLSAVLVEVRDTGVGMEEETRRHLFDKFFQADRSHATDGNGLGLSLVKRIVELSGGRIMVDSKVGEGSAFSVILPK